MDLLLNPGYLHLSCMYSTFLIVFLGRLGDLLDHGRGHMTKWPGRFATGNRSRAEKQALESTRVTLVSQLTQAVLCT